MVVVFLTNSRTQAGLMIFQYAICQGSDLLQTKFYREDGFRRQEHEFEDRSIHVRLDNYLGYMSK